MRCPKCGLEQEEAVACRSQALEAQPDDSRAFIGRAPAHDSRGDRRRALEDLTEACRLGDPRGCSIADQLDTQS